MPRYLGRLGQRNDMSRACLTHLVHLIHLIHPTQKDAIAAKSTAPRYFHLGEKVPGLLHVLEVARGWYKARTTAAPHVHLGLPSIY